MSQLVEQAVAAAREAQQIWAPQPLEVRKLAVQTLAKNYGLHREELAAAIVRQTLKPRWEARAEVDAMIAKAAICVEAYDRRCGWTASDQGGVRAVTHFRPHGVVAVLGPFNMPGHLPNGHIMPALLAGNAVVFKPSEHAAEVGRRMAEAWRKTASELSLAAEVFALVEGGPETGRELAAHPNINGVFFTGSATVGLALSRLLADHPEKILALEMGGNNPLIVHDVVDLRAAASLVIQSAYITAGQRCSCARRLIVCRGQAGDAFVTQLMQMIEQIRVGLPDDDPEPFMGPVISAPAARQLLDAQADLQHRGAAALVEMRRLERWPALLSPGLLDVSAVQARDDVEHFGPLLQLVRVADFEAALVEGNATRYGLSAGLLCDSRELFARFSRRIHAGVIAWNRPMTGASSRLPFGGVGQSGNHRASAYFAADYCAYPVASLESEHLQPTPNLPGLPT